MNELVAKHIVEADKLIRAGRYEEAKLEVDYILGIEPKNYYARSLQERVRTQLKKNEQKAQEQLQRETDLMDHKVQTISELLKVAEKYIEEHAYRKALDQVSKVYTIDPYNHFAQVYSTRIQTLIDAGMKESPAAAAAKLSAAPKAVSPVFPKKEPAPPTKPPAAPLPVMEPDEVPPAPIFPGHGESQATNAQTAMYKQLLREMWFDGKLSDKEQKELAGARDRLKISPEDHIELEREVKIDAYIEALRIAWADGVVSNQEKEMLQLMRDKYGISMDEHVSAEATILWAKNTSIEKKTLLVADDDPAILLSLAARLKFHGYNVLTADTVEKALQLLESSSPSLILSDVNFLNSEMDGFEFYAQVRRHPALKGVPFLFMSGISDELVVRTGMRLGADHFLTKPLNFELLLATIEGKIK